MEASAGKGTDPPQADWSPKRSGHAVSEGQDVRSERPREGMCRPEPGWIKSG
jgi:hypothetical protein